MISVTSIDQNLFSFVAKKLVAKVRIQFYQHPIFIMILTIKSTFYSPYNNSKRSFIFLPHADIDPTWFLCGIREPREYTFLEGMN